MVCGADLSSAFRAVEDHVYGVPGRWDLDRCINQACSVIHLAHDLTAAEIRSFYQNYSTHSPPVLNATGLKGFYRAALKHIIHRRLSYPTMQRGRAAILGRVLEAIPFFREMAASRAYWLPHRPDGVAIEIGFGNGQGLTLLREVGWTTRGSELDSDCVALARGMGFDVVHGEFTNHIFGAESADAVVASHAIEHVPDPRAFFREAHRVLRKGGRLVLRTPNAASADARRTGAAWRGLEVPRHLTIHSPGSLLLLAEQTGFVGSQVHGTPLGGFIAQQSRELQRGETPAFRQSRKTVPFNVLETVRSIVQNRDCAEIVLICIKH